MCCLSVGQTPDDVARLLGPPTGRAWRAGGVVVQSYSREPVRPCGCLRLFVSFQDGKVRSVHAAYDEAWEAHSLYSLTQDETWQVRTFDRLFPQEGGRGERP